MEISDEDFELLGTYLDGELPVVQCESLWRRLATEPALAAELDAHRRDRAVRKQVWTALEPADARVADLQKRLASAARRHDAFNQASRMARLVTTAAACIVFGFTIGWIGREKATHQQAIKPDVADPHVRPVVDTNPGITFPGQGSTPGPYVVTVQDDFGRPIATQTFSNLQEAQNFAQAIRAQRGRDSQQVPVVPVSDPF